MNGEADPALFTKEAQQAIVPRIKEQKGALASFGALKKLELHERKQSDEGLKLAYRVSLSTRPATCTLTSMRRARSRGSDCGRWIERGFMAATAQTRVTDRSRRFPWLTGGMGRRLAIGVALGWIVLVGVTIWRMRSLDELPDVGDPFDVALGAAAGRDRRCGQRLRRLCGGAPEALEPAEPDRRGTVRFASTVRLGRREEDTDLVIGLGGRSRVRGRQTRGPGDLAGRELASRCCLSTTERVVRRVGAVSDRGCETLRRLGGPGGLARSRSRQAREDAWDWYRAMLRSSRLVGRHGYLVQRLFGAGSTIWPLVASCDGRPTRASEPARSAAHWMTRWPPIP